MFLFGASFRVRLRRSKVEDQAQGMFCKLHVYSMFKATRPPLAQRLRPTLLSATVRARSYIPMPCRTGSIPASDLLALFVGWDRPCLKRVPCKHRYAWGAPTEVPVLFQTAGAKESMKHISIKEHVPFEHAITI